jgi:hypothetical protein
VGGISVGGEPLTKVSSKEITDLNESIVAKDEVNRLVDKYIANIEKYGTQTLFGKGAGERESLKTNLMLSMKSLAKTGALDQGTIDVLAGIIPSSKFFATQAAQKKSLETLRDTVNSKSSDYIGSYSGTTAEVDPRTKRAFEQNSIFAPDEKAALDKAFSSSTASIYFQ